MDGYIKLHRKIFDNWIFERGKPLSYFEAWILLLCLANYSKQSFLVDGQLIVCNRGQIFRSIKSLSTQFGWSEKRVKHFLKLLSKDGMINTKGFQKGTIITICNYNTYQEIWPTEVLPEVLPEVRPEALPEVLPEVLSEVPTEVLPEALPEVLSEVLSEVQQKSNESLHTIKDNNVNNVNKNNDNTSKRSASLFFVDEVKDIVIQNQPWVEAASRRLGIDVQTTKMLVADFSDHLHTIGVSKKSERDFKSHFSNWARKVASQKKEFPEPRAQNIEATPGRQSSILSKLLQDDETRLGQNLS